MRRVLFLILLASAAPLSVVRAQPKAPDFDKVIAPLLAARCLDCHSGTTAKGKLDLAKRGTALVTGAKAVIVPGKSNESVLWERVRDNEMPPKKALSADEKKLLKAWIDSGAEWGSDPIDPFRYTTASRAGYDWWSLKPIRKSEEPNVKKTAWVRNPIDAFILSRLEAANLTPSPEAGRRTLIRRLALDLTGLPAAPEEIETFVADTRPDAYEALVDRLLASPHYGERWARHWLDLVRFGESDGFERDLPRLNAWPYRDWVVDALNRDMPYDQFAQMQLAGDILMPDDPAAVAATGFLVAGAHDIVMPVSGAMIATMRQDELEDIVGNVGQTFLGLTVHCARCHDHKFDPISQKDFYRFAAALAGVKHGERTVVNVADRKHLADLRERAAMLREQLAALEEPARAAARAGHNEELPEKGPRPIAEWSFDSAGAPGVTLTKTARLDHGLVLDGKDAYAYGAPLTTDLREKTLEAWLRLDNHTQRGGGVMSVQSLDGGVFDGIVFGENEPKHWMAGSDGFRRTKSFSGPEETNATAEIVSITITYGANGTITGYRNGKPYGKAYKSDGPVTFKAGTARVVFGIRHEPAGGNKMLAGTIVGARLYDRALTAKEVAISSRVPTVSESEILAHLTVDQRKQWAVGKEQAQALARDLTTAESKPAYKVFAVVPENPKPTHLLLRGNVTTPGEVVEPGPIAVLADRGPVFDLKANSSDGGRRLALAKWITSPDNPLFARVIVNRLWHHHFGVGLVDTPSDFGFNGGRPSHPELLDWLASELVRQKGSFKQLHRTIVLSATYRQSSRQRTDAMTLDADNRLLWRRSPQRLEAEAVRDTLLDLSGQLDRSVGGQGYQDFRSFFFKGTQFYEPIELTSLKQRRTIYRMWARGGRNPFLDTFDCPDPSTTTPRRAVTTTPLQALALWNNALTFSASEQFARRIRNEVGDDVNKQIKRAYLLAYGRKPEADEVALVRPFLEQHGLAALARVIFNSNEFVTID